MVLYLADLAPSPAQRDGLPASASLHFRLFVNRADKGVFALRDAALGDLLARLPGGARISHRVIFGGQVDKELALDRDNQRGRFAPPLNQLSPSPKQRTPP